MNLRLWLVDWTLRGLTRLLCRLDLAELKKIPMRGPLLLVANHVNFLEVPLLRARLSDRPLIGLTKVESFDDPLRNFLFNTWGAIPIKRGEVDRAAFQRCLEVLAQGKLLTVAPEGTRSGNGQLLPGRPGIALLAVRSAAPLLPIAYYGHEQFWENVRRLRRTPFHLRVGAPFCVNASSENPGREERQAITDEIMRRIAELMPEKYYGYYRGAGQVAYRYTSDIRD